SEKRPGAEASALVTAHLFGRVEDTKAKEQVLSQVEAPQTQLQLLLEGVFLAEREEDSGAIVVEKGKSAEFYKTGDRLPGNAELVGVFPDRVVLRRQGRLETLSFEDSAAAKQTVQKVEQPRVS